MTRINFSLRSVFASLCGLLLLLHASARAMEVYDIVLGGGRVMDPESGLDAVRNVGIRDGKIALVSEQPLAGIRTIELGGLVVAPGFIDLHAHGQANDANEYQAHDGVTTALELESGVPFPGAFLRSRQGNAMLNFGATVSHGMARTAVMPQYADLAAAVKNDLANRELSLSEYASLMKGAYDKMEPDQLGPLRDLLELGLREGALGIGMTHQYYPGADRNEIFRVFQLAAKWRAPIFTHVREAGIDAMQEVIANSAVTGAPVHIVHANSSSLWELPLVLEMIEAAQQRGLDVTTEAYPYTAASTLLQSALFDPGWQDKFRISYGDLQWQESGERLTETTFARYREKGGIVIVHLMKPEWISYAMAAPFVMVASDGLPYAPGAHPRSAGTFARVLGYYVREQNVLSLMEALGKMTLMPARRLEAIAPQMKNKGRLRAGADADITVFDPDTVKDTATFESDLSFSAGIEHVLVNGVLVVEHGKTVRGALPGRAVTGLYLNGEEKAD